MSGDLVALIVAVVALVVGLLLAVAAVCVVPLICCLLCKTRKEIRVLRAEQRRLNTVENGKKPKLSDIQEYDREPSRLSTPFPEDCPASPHTPTPSQPQTIPDPSKSYNHVNIGNFLPDDLRTPENLESGEVPEGELGEKLLETHRRQQAQYEEREVVRASVGGAQSGRKEGGGGEEAIVPGYEEVNLGDSEDVYNNPIDALALMSNPPPTRFSSSAFGSSANRKFQIPEGARPPKPDEYSDVFDHLPQGKMELVARPPVVQNDRTLSDTSLQARQKAGRMIGGYEDVGGSSSEEGGMAVKPGSLPTGSLEHLAEEDTQERHFSMPAGRRHAVGRDDKEMVSFDRTANKYMTESMRKKKPVPMAMGNESTKINGHKVCTSVGDSPDGPSKKSTEMVDSSDGSVSPDSYSVVNIADKKRYRAEADGMKKDGSGAPSHYRPSEKLPEVQEGVRETIDL